MDDLRKTIQKLENCLSAMVSMLEIASINGSMQSSLTQPTSKLPIQCERPLPGHQFCLILIVWSSELPKRVGFRAAADAMRILFDMLNIDTKVPSHDAIEQWTLRLGVASMKNPFKDGRRE